MLEIKNLHARVGDKPILKGINLTVGAGEIHAIMGLTALANQPVQRIGRPWRL